MLTKLKTNFLYIILCLGIGGGLLGLSSITYAQETKPPVVIVEPEKEIKEAEPEISPPPVDEIALKQREMRNTTVLISTFRGNGSGTIIDRLTTDIKETFEYRVLTNAHVIRTRLITRLKTVNSLTGKVKTEIVDTGCTITIFDYQNQDRDQYNTKIITENIPLDLAILSFLSTKKLNVTKIANSEMLSQVRVFDEVFAIGCQLSQIPTPTTGIISRILTKDGKEWVIYGSTTPIAPGSSGGGLYKKYDGHYYLIGIPYKTTIAYNGQFIPHLAYAISIATAKNFIGSNSVCIE